MNIEKLGENKEYKFKKFQGITLISLVITIIILLILSSITIRLSVGENGIFAKARSAKIDTKRAQVVEYLNMRLLEEQTVNYGKTNKEIIESTRKNIINNKKELEKIGKEVEIKEIVEENENIYFYVVVDKDVYKVSNEEIKYIGTQNKEDVELEEGDIKFTYSKSNPTNENVKIKIESEKQAQGYKLEYKTEKTGESGEVEDWTSYTEEITVTRNQKIYARLVNIMGKTSEAEGKVTNIDKLPPNIFTPTVSATLNSIKISALATDQEKTNDNESSGIVEYRFSKDDGNTWTAYQTSGEYTYSNLTPIAGYKVKVEAKDAAGNTKESTIVNLTAKYHTHTATCKHTHTGNPTYGGGCYGNVVAIYHTHVPSCYTERKCNGNMYYCWDNLNGTPMYKCNVCGHIDEGHDGQACTKKGETVNICGKNQYTVESQYYTINCGRDEVSNYCGKNNNTIESYTIVY